MRLYQNLSSQFTPFYDEQNKLFDFTVASLQWDKAIRARLRREGRPANSYNLIRTILNVIFSVERDNRMIGKPKPRTTGDNELTNVVWQTLNFYLYHAGFSKAQKRVFMDKVVARLGVYHVGWRYTGSTDDKGKLFTESCDPREFMWELNYNDTLWEQSSYVMRKHQMSLEEILSTFALNDRELAEVIQWEAKQFFEHDPEKGKWISRRLKAMITAVYETATGFNSNRDNLFTNYLQWWDPSTGKFDVLELHEKRMEKRLIVPDSERNKDIDITDTYNRMYKESNGKESEDYLFDNELVGKIREQYGLQGEPKEDLQNRKFTTAVIPTFNIKVNEQPYPFESKYYVYIPEYCYDTHADPIKVQSVMDDLVDPQADFNKAKSLILELLARYANKGWIMDENAIDGLEEDWTTNRIAPYRRVRSGYINMIKPEPAQTISEELVRMPLEVQQLMKVITNADDEIRGNRSPGVTSGKHFIAKEERQAKSFAMILENRDDSQKAVSELSLQFIQHYVKTQEVIRITQDIPGMDMKTNDELIINQSVFDMKNGELSERVVNDIDAIEYDIEITEEPYSISAQDERYNKLGDIFNAALAVDPKKANAMLPIIVKATGSPESTEILKQWEKLDQPNPQADMLQQMMIQIQMIMAKLGVEEKKTDIEGKKLDNIETAKNIENLERDNFFNTLDRVKGNDQPKKKTNGKQQPQKKAV
jgi:hypothetical protein